MEKKTSKPQPKKTQPKKIPAPTLVFEVGVGFPGVLVAGVDEVGRGCLAGEVVAGACVLPAEWGEMSLRDLRRKHQELKLVTDSKQLDAETRAALAPWIRENVRAFGIGSCTVEEIDRWNIFHASHRAMIRAVENLRCRHDGSRIDPAWLLVDGKFLPREWSPARAKAIIKGDLHSLSIACASILAKVHRDDAISALDSKYPGYGFASHKGYATPEHREALARLGATEIHRKSFAPVREQMLKDDPTLFSWGMSLQDSWDGAAEIAEEFAASEADAEMAAQFATELATPLAAPLAAPLATASGDDAAADSTENT